MRKRYSSHLETSNIYHRGLTLLMSSFPVLLRPLGLQRFLSSVLLKA